jgi:PAS domain-containing protein
VIARRRIEDALRSAESLLRALADGAPVSLGLFRPDGTLLTANIRLARMLGYEFPTKLQALSATFGVFVSPEDQLRALGSSCTTPPGREALFRRKDGCRRTHLVMTGESTDGHAITLAVFQSSPPPGFPVLRPAPLRSGPQLAVSRLHSAPVRQLVGSSNRTPKELALQSTALPPS